MLVYDIQSSLMFDKKYVQTQAKWNAWSQSAISVFVNLNQ